LDLINIKPIYSQQFLSHSRLMTSARGWRICEINPAIHHYHFLPRHFPVPYSQAIVLFTLMTYAVKKTVKFTWIDQSVEPALLLLSNLGQETG